MKNSDSTQGFAIVLQLAACLDEDLYYYFHLSLSLYSCEVLRHRHRRRSSVVGEGKDLFQPNNGVTFVYWFRSVENLVGTITA